MNKNKSKKSLEKGIKGNNRKKYKNISLSLSRPVLLGTLGAFLKNIKFGIF
jgi:hypothetical protein